jgi:tRNA(adenine34) deaminase
MQLTMRKPSLCPFPKIFPSQLEKGNLFFMQLAYNEAINAWNADEVPVGAIIARGDEVIASSFNQTRRQVDPSAHAEMIAITMAAKSVGDWRLNDCRLYITKEPCPMCSGATIMARLGEVHFAVDDPKMGGLGGATSLHSLPFSNHKPKVYRQTMELECKEMLQAFFQLQRQ